MKYFLFKRKIKDTYFLLPLLLFQNDYWICKNHLQYKPKFKILIGWYKKQFQSFLDWQVFLLFFLFLVNHNLWILMFLEEFPLKGSFYVGYKPILIMLKRMFMCWNCSVLTPTKLIIKVFTEPFYTNLGLKCVKISCH